jgi:hypothetical protein
MLGIILLIIGFIAAIPILWTAGGTTSKHSEESFVESFRQITRHLSDAGAATAALTEPPLG